jgi:hypothetical protein
MVIGCINLVQLKIGWNITQIASAYFSCLPIAPNSTQMSCGGDDVKANAVGRQRPKNQAEMISNIRSYLRSTQRQPSVVQNFFREKHVAYAAA